MDNEKLTRAEAQGVRYAAELEAHLRWLDSFSAAALGVLSHLGFTHISGLRRC
jgi:hypothetical protein